MLHSRYLFILTVLMGFGYQSKLHAQNLVPNGSFEEGAKCQTNYDKSRVPKPWKITGTPDLYLDSCELISPSQNVIGACALLSGKAVVGIVWDLPSKHNHYWVERLQTRLKEPLLRDSLYQFSMFIYLGSYSPSSIKQISVRLGPEIDSHYTPPKEIITIDIPKPLISGNWVHLADTFKAAGGERYLVIGNYLEAENFTKLRKSKPSNIKCYLFIDSVSLIPLFQPQTLVENEVADTVTLAGLNFNFNEATLLPEAYPVLGNILSSLPQEEEYSLQIIGHTDSIGNFENNILLSLKRAEAVKTYFTNFGVDSTLITVEGSGPTHPIAPNKTEVGRAINRRVEIIIKRW